MRSENEQNCRRSDLIAFLNAPQRWMSALRFCKHTSERNVPHTGILHRKPKSKLKRSFPDIARTQSRLRILQYKSDVFNTGYRLINKEPLLTHAGRASLGQRTSRCGSAGWLGEEVNVGCDLQLSLVLPTVTTAILSCQTSGKTGTTL